MSYYIAIDPYGDISLKHHGIKGMRWGIRRYQNKDGSLTPAGEKRYASKSRYFRGREYNKELSDARDKEEERLKNASKTYQKAEKEANRLVRKYGLDMDDYGRAGSNFYNREQMRAVNQRYWNLREDMSALDDEFYEKADKKAKDMLSSKYGSKALSDVHHYQVVNGALTVAAMLSVYGIASYIIRR